MKSPLVSIIVPVYNVPPRLLERCIRSIVEQTYTDIEIFLVDDGSTDTCGTTCDSWSRTDNRILSIHQSNQGPSVARNNALDKANGDYILFVDGDDYIEATLVEKCVGVALEKDADLVIFNFCRERDGVRTPNTLKQSCYQNSKSLYEGILWDWVPSYPFKFYKRSLWQAARFPEGMVWEDFIIMPNIIRNVRVCVLLDEVLYHYERGNPNSISRRTQSTNKYCWFCGWKNRQERATELHNDVLLSFARIKSLRLAITALGLNACDHQLSSQRVAELQSFIGEARNDSVSGMGIKYLFLAWAIKHCPLLLWIYGKASYSLADIKQRRFKQ